MNMMAARLRPGAISESSSSHLPPSEASLAAKPVMFPPGWLSRGTMPLATGSPPLANARRSGNKGQFSEVSKGVIQNDICEFESSRPSKRPVSSPRSVASHPCHVSRWARRARCSALRLCAPYGACLGSPDHFVRHCKQHRRHFEAERLCSLLVDDELDLLACSTGMSAGFSPLRIRSA